MGKRKITNEYVNNKKMLEVIVDYKHRVEQAENDGKQKPRIPEYVGECLQKIAEHYATLRKFSSYPFTAEMIGDAIENCLMYFDNFDPAKSSNPFAYFTRIVHFAFIRRIAREKKELYIKHKAIQKSMVDFALVEESGELQINVTENMDDFVKTYELKQAEKKQKLKEKAALKKQESDGR